MAEIELNADDLTGNFTGMTKDQIYQLMSQMKSLIDQNEQQARHILIQNPKLTQVLFQAQIMLGMVRPNLPNPNNPAASTHPQQAALPPQQTNVQAALPLPGQSDLKDQTKVSQTTNSLRKTNQPVMPVPSTSIPFNSQSQPLQSHPLQSVQGHLNAQASTMPVPQSSQFQNMHPSSLHSASPQPSSLPQPPMPSASTQSQQSLHTSGMSHMQLQPSMPSQARPASVPAFGHQLNTQMGPNAAFQHSNTAVQMHHSQPMFHSGQNHPPGVGHSISQGHQPPRQLLYQGGNPHLGMEFNHVGGPVQAERGPSWIPGPRDNATGTQHIPGPPPPSFMGSQMGPANPPLRPPSLSSDMESALLQQVMSLTPEQINLLPPEQRNQVLQLQQMLRQSQ